MGARGNWRLASDDFITDISCNSANVHSNIMIYWTSKELTYFAFLTFWLWSNALKPENSQRYGSSWDWLKVGSQYYSVITDISCNSITTPIACNIYWTWKEFTTLANVVSFITLLMAGDVIAMHNSRTCLNMRATWLIGSDHGKF